MTSNKKVTQISAHFSIVLWYPLFVLFCAIWTILHILELFLFTRDQHWTLPTTLTQTKLPLILFLICNSTFSSRTLKRRYVVVNQIIWFFRHFPEWCGYINIMLFSHYLTNMGNYVPLQTLDFHDSLFDTSSVHISLTRSIK